MHWSLYVLPLPGFLHALWLPPTVHNRHIRLNEDSDLFIVWVCVWMVCVSRDRPVTWSGHIPAFSPVTAKKDSSTPWAWLWIRSSKLRMSEVRSRIQAYLLIYNLYAMCFLRFILKCKQYKLKFIIILTQDISTYSITSVHTELWKEKKSFSYLELTTAGNVQFGLAWRDQVFIKFVRWYWDRHTWKTALVFSILLLLSAEHFKLTVVYFV